jgi:predicted membrane protein
MSDDKEFDSKKSSDDLHDQIHRDVHEGLKIRASRAHRGGLFWGAVLTLGGLALLLDQMGIISVDRLWRFWPMILILVGLWNLTCQSARVFGAVMVILGVLFQLDTLGIAHFRWEQLWPIAIVAAGLLILWRSLQERKVPKTVNNAIDGESQADSRATLNEVAIFGSIERRITSQDFQGGLIHAVFGSVELDLRDVNIQQDEAILEINSVFGSVELRVPDAWQITSRGQAVFGSFQDDTRNYRNENPANPLTKSLILTGAAVFGSVEIKN